MESAVPYVDFETLGIDIAVLPDLSESEALVIDFDCLAQDLMNGWTQPTGIADGTDEGREWGTDIAGYLNQGLSSQQLFALKVQLEVQAERDDRVERATVMLTATVRNQLFIDAVVYTGAGPFSFSVKVTQNTAGDLYAERLS